MQNKLPDELVLRVFYSLDPLSIARVERTCRQWHRVARDNHRLWQDGMSVEGEHGYEHGGERTSAKRLAKRIKALRSRGGGQLHSLEFVVRSYLGDPYAIEPGRAVALAKDAQKMAWLLWLLPQLQVRELSIKFSGLDFEAVPPARVRGTQVPSGQELQRQLSILPHMAKASLLQCGSLTSLTIDSPMYLDRFDTDLLDEVSFRGSPLAACRLKHFSSSLGCTALFTSDVWKAWLGSASYIMLALPVRAPMPPLSLLFSLLENAKDTMEYLSVTLPFRRSGGAQERIYLPRLKELYIQDIGTIESGSSYIPPARLLVCPALRHLRVEVTQPWRFFCDVLCHRSSCALQSLHLLSDAKKLEKDTEAMAKALKECVGPSLRTLLVWGNDATTLIEQLLQRPDLLIDDVDLLDPYNAVDASRLVALVKSRFGNDANRPLRKLTLVRWEPFDDAKTAWLEDNVEKFVVDCSLAREDESDEEERSIRRLQWW